jgi:hypothetical protein
MPHTNLKLLTKNQISTPMSSASDASGTEDPAATPIPMEAVATLLTLGLGLLYWFCFRPGGVTAPSSSSAGASSSANTSAGAPEAPPKAREERYRTFVDMEVSANETVLFVADGGRLDSFRTLFDALQVSLHVVDLARTAGGSRVLEALREEYDQDNEQQEFLFVKGAFVGGHKELHDLLVDGRKDELGPQCDWSCVRVDSKSETGFMLLGPLNGFQCAEDIGEEEERPTKLETNPLASVEELRHFDPTTLIGCSVPIASRSRTQRRRSKLLVCHDMKGGYQEDRFKQVWPSDVERVRMRGM